MLTHLEMTGNSLNSLNLRGANDAFQKNLLAHIALPSNGISKLTMVDNYGVHHLNLAGNRLTEFSMRDTDNMETLDLSGNALSTLNLSYCERLVSARLSDNCLTEIVMPADVTYLDELDIRGNRFTFATLPMSAELQLYTYAGQEALNPNFANGISDLSATAAAADGTPTTFRWFIGEPYYDEYGELTGEELITDEEFNTENGVTSFYKALDGIVGALTNDALPGLVLLTEEFDITSTVGIDVLTIDPQTTVSGIYATDGRRSGSEGRGIRIYRMTDGTSLKVLR